MNTDSNNQPLFAITGATGFVGQYVVDYFLHACRANLILIVRNPAALSPTHMSNPRIRIQEIADLGSKAALPVLNRALTGATAVFHLAARAHVMREPHADPQDEYNHHNLESTRYLAEACVTQNVKRLVFLSSIKVLGEQNYTDEHGQIIPFRESDPLIGNDPYAVSKQKAEALLRTYATERGLNYTIFRPPLLYGPGVKANFRSLIKLVRSGVPLPFGGIHNQRSILFVGNLADAMLRCIDLPTTNNETFLISDAKTVSTAELVQHLARAMNKKARLLPIKPRTLKFICTLAGRQQAYDRLCGSLSVDSQKIMKAMNWQPPFDLQQGLHATLISLNPRTKTKTIATNR